MIASTTESQLRRCLEAVRFPASSDDLLAAALGNRCDEETIDALRALPAVTYTSLRQVIASAGVVDTAVGDVGERGPT